MESLNIEAQDDSPKIYFEHDVGFIISGKSLPENAFDFYAPVLEWSKIYFNAENTPKNVMIDFNLRYFNTASSKQIAKLLRIIEESRAKNNVTINWHYEEEDVDMLKAGKRYEKLIKLKFSYTEIKEEEE